MCRFIGYIGKPLLVDEVLIKPENSLIKQSYQALEAPEPLNGDGFGLGWYAHDVDLEPGLFTSIQPAWNNQNLVYLAKKIRTDAFMAHIRAASKGGVTKYNCHPFHYKRLLFMHNGTIGGFENIKRYLRRELSDDIYSWIKGQTDSEHFFALFLHLFNKKKLSTSAENISIVLTETIDRLEHFMKKYDKDSVNFINGVVSDGKSMVAIRYVSDPSKKARTLYYASGEEYHFRDGQSHMVASENGNEAVIIVSEKLTHYVCEWHEVPTNHILIISEDLSIKTKTLS